MPVVETNFRVGRILVPVQLDYQPDKRINLHFGYNRDLLAIIKNNFEGRKWLGPPINPNGPKIWQIPITQRNVFWLKYLQNQENPYAKYDAALDPNQTAPWIAKVKEYESVRLTNCKYKSLFTHQREMVAHALMTRTFIWAAEMGTGKTLAAFIFMEMCELLGYTKLPTWWWVAPLSALRSFQMEVRAWSPKVRITTMTYENFKGRVIDGQPCPSNVIFDESPKIKTPSAIRSIAARNLTNDMRDSYQGEHIIGLMSGSPAPKSPLDWWHQCEITEPGYLSEKDLFVFREKLGVFEDANEGAYKKHVTWLDNTEKCAVCYELREHKSHNIKDANDVDIINGKVHAFVESVDQVSKLNHRLRGLVGFWLKKDCLDLPDKTYEQRILKPTRETLLAARLIADNSRRVIDALTRLRMLSDGFQYTEQETGKKPCKECQATGSCEQWFDPEEPEEYIPVEWMMQGTKPVVDEDGEVISYKSIKYEKRVAACPNCEGSGSVPTYTRGAIRVECPKDAALAEDLDAHEENGRLCVYAGFTESVDRVVENCHKAGWSTIRADGRGWEGKSPYGEILDNARLLEFFQEGFTQYPKLCFVGQPASAGEGLTLTASHAIIFWSNDFNGNSRMQAEDRGHRPGMDKEKGGRIIDYFHLPSDLYVYKNLKLKKELQRQTMTGFREFMNVSSFQERE